MPVYPSGGTIAQSAGSPGFGPAPTPSFNASASVRFNTGDSAFASFTPTLEGSRSTWTMAFWVKRSALSSRQFLFSNLNGAASAGFQIEFDANDCLDINNFSASAYQFRLITTQVFRDVANWYHITVTCDTAQSTNSNRLKLYVNGVQVTAFSTATYPTQFFQGLWNQSGVFSAFGKAGAYTVGINYFYNGYLADANFVDGLALTPSSFTATDANTGQLVPAQYTGNRGTNGFYLPFSSAALAVDLGQNPKTTGQDYPYWRHNTLLVDTTSTNGAQNNTFLDSSTNNFTITRNGNTTQGNFTPFNFGGGTTQADGYYSGYFDGTGDYLTVPDNVALQMGASNFTIEGWFYPFNFSTDKAIMIHRPAVTARGIVLGFYQTTGTPFILAGDNNSSAWNINLTSSAPAILNVWNHVAYTRNGSSWNIWLNGVSVASGTASFTMDDVGNIWIFESDVPGATFPGYVSNFRIVKGTALYTANFTVPTTPPTAISGTSLLTCQNSQFIDNSANAFAVTANGNAQPSVANPFGMTAWSNFFDGTGDYLTVPSATATTLNADFTIEYFMYRPAAGNNWMFTLGDAFLSSGIETYIGSSGTAFNLWSANAVRITSSTLPTIGAWSHVAMVRSGSTVTLYLNGVSLGTWTSSATFSGITYIGAERYNGSITGLYTGYLSNVRIVKGTAVYTANFTPPTAPLTAISGTSLLTCQSSTFIDNSTNAFAITVNGNPYTLTLNNPFNSPVNSTPPVQAWSYSFDGTGDFISVPTNTNTNMHQNGDWTYEGWIYWNSMPTTGYQNVFGQGVAGQNSFGLTAYNGTSWSAPYYFVVNQANIGNVLVGKTVLVANNWYHFAVVRRGGVVTLYVNGFAEGTYSNATNYAFGANPFTIGNSSNGYISNFRFVRSAVYNANFTPPTAPLTTIQNTQLLTCQSNRMVDNSLNNYTVTPSGNTAISPVSPFFPTTAWSAASYGGAMYFDGTGDSLSLPSSSQLAMGTGDFTWELWINQQASTSFRTFIDTRTGSGNLGLFLGTNTGTTNLYVSNDTTALITSSVSFNLNVWNHVALVRFSNTLTVYLNGTPVGSASYSTNMTNTTGTIGAGIFANPYVGYMSGLRILKGTALYTGPFVPPVLPPTNISSTSLLLNATNSGIYDATGQNVIETVGNAQVSTAVKKFGESSMSFDGSGDILIIQPTERMVFGTADFTVETWVYPTATQAQFATIVSNASTPNGWYLAFSTGNLVYFSNQATVAITSSSGLANNVWTHVAVSRVGTTIRMFFNGVQVASATNSTTYGVSTAVTYVASNGSTNYFLGYLQDLRVTRGAGRYSGNFTPPAAAFAYNQYDIGNQQWLPTNISVTAGVGQDNLVDSPSDYGTDTGLGGQVRGNYATMNFVDNGGLALANGNLDATRTGTSWLSVRATIQGITSGKWYWECTTTTAISSTAYPIVGVAWNSQSLANFVGQDAFGYGCSFFSGQKYNNNVNTNYGTAFVANNIMGVAFDADNGKIWFSKNGTWFASGDPVAGTNAAFTGIAGQVYAPTFSVYGGTTTTLVVNFGQRAFSYTAPAGFKCLVSTNLPTVNGIGATSTTRASNYFNANTWTGNGTQIPVSFDPSLIWYKSTNAIGFGGWIDQIRGDNYYMQTYNTVASTLASGLLTTNSTGFVPGAEFAANSYVSYSWRGADTLSWSFDGSLERTATMTIASPCVVTLTSNGFSAGQAVRFTTTGALPTGIVAGTTYYAGNIVTSTFNLYDTEANAIAGGATGRVNTSGSQSGTQTCEHAARISANQTSGFSVTQYIGIGANTTIPHGLGAAPELWFIKCSGTTGNWYAFTTTLDGSVDYTYLNGQQNLTNAGAGYTTLPTSTVVSIGVDADSNTNGVTYMLYSYVSIPGFSKVGVYTGNGAADGPMIYTNFSPEMMLLKRVSGTPIDNWYNLDVPRSPYNVVSNYLIPNSSAAQASATFVDFLSNGFKVRAAGAYENASGSAYLYLAIASAPFKYSRAY